MILSLRSSLSKRHHSFGTTFITGWRPRRCVCPSRHSGRVNSWFKLSAIALMVRLPFFLLRYLIHASETAHADVYEKCKFVHCDISSGNLLILPSLVSVPGEAALRVVWTGILGDWELATAAVGSMATERRGRMVSHTYNRLQHCAHECHRAPSVICLWHCSATRTMLSA